MRASNAPKAGTPSYYPLGTPEACAGGVAAVRRVERAPNAAPQVERATGLLRQYVCSTMVGSGAGVQARAARVWGCVCNWAQGGRESLVRVAAWCRF